MPALLPTTDVAPKVLLDTTTLCAAMRNPGGSGMKLLRLGLLGLFEPIVTEEIIAEWVRNCRKGLGQGKLKITFTENDLDAFCEALEPVLSDEMVARVRIGRAASPLYPVRQEGGLKVIQMPLGQPAAGSRMLDDITLGLKDVGDFHVVEAALRYQCDYLCTRNTKDFADGLQFGPVEVITPESLFTELTEPERIGS